MALSTAIPPELRAAIGKREITVPLGASEAAALRGYPAAHARAEALLKQAAASALRSLPMPTSIDLHAAAHASVRNMGLTPSWAGWGEPDDAEGVAREVEAECIAAKYPQDDPVGVSEQDAAQLRALMLGSRDQRPEVTLADAKRQYLTDKVTDNAKWQRQVERIFGLVSDVLPLETPLHAIRRSDARQVRDHLLDGREPSSNGKRIVGDGCIVGPYALTKTRIAGVRPLPSSSQPADHSSPCRSRTR